MAGKLDSMRQDMAVLHCITFQQWSYETGKKTTKKQTQDMRSSGLDSKPSPPLLLDVSQFRKPVTTCHQISFQMCVINTHVTSPKQ